MDPEMPDTDGLYAAADLAPPKGEVVNPTPEVAWRDDEVGRLARAAGGTLDDATPPDPSAVPLLIDALIGTNHHDEAAKLSTWLVNVAVQYRNVFPSYAENWSRMFNNDWGYLTRDLYSCAAVISGRIAESLKPIPDPVKSSLDTFRVQLGQNQCRVGRRVQYQDGTQQRSGIVARVHSDRWCDVVPTDTDGDYADDAGEPPYAPG